jgi:HEAT repeat protein
MGQQPDQNGPEELIARLSHADPEVRAAAADRLRWIRPRAVGAVPELVKLLADQSRKVRLAAIFALRSIDPTNEAFTGLTDLLEDSHSAEVDFLRWLLEELEPGDEGIVELVIALLELQLGQDLLDSHNLIIKSIVSIGPRAILPLIGFLFSDDDWVVRCACHALAEFGSGATAAIPDLTQLLYSNDAKSQEAARTLGKIGPAAKSAVPVLVALLERNPGSGLLVEALGEIGSDAATSLPLLIEELLEYVDDDDAQEFVVDIAWTLNSIGLEALTQFKPAVIQATPLLIDKLMSCEASNPYWESSPIIETVSAILRIGIEHAAPHLATVWLGDEHPKNRYAESLLVNIGAPALHFLLARAASCSDPRLREKVEDLIESMGEEARPALLEAADASGSAVSLLARRLLRFLDEEA